MTIAYLTPILIYVIAAILIAISLSFIAFSIFNYFKKDNTKTNAASKSAEIQLTTQEPLVNKETQTDPDKKKANLNHQETITKTNPDNTKEQWERKVSTNAKAKGDINLDDIIKNDKEKQASFIDKIREEKKEDISKSTEKPKSEAETFLDRLDESKEAKAATPTL